MLRRIAFSCCFFICCLSSAWSQHYVFIESDGQPFYVKKSGKVYSSSSSGFLIIPKVADSTLVLTVGFPRNQFPELSFSFALMDRDRGFQLKKMDDKGWLLFDRSSMETIEVGNQLVSTPAPVPQEKKGFADVLMQVTGDSSLVTKSPEQKGNEKSLGATVQIERAEVKVDVPVENKQTIRVTNNNKEEVVDIEIDKGEKAIKPMPIKSEVEKAKPIEEKVEPKVVEATKGVEKEKTVQSDNVKTRDDERQDRESKVAVEEANKVQAVKSLRVCSAPFASDKDVKSLKKKMLGIVSDQAIVDAVIKAMGERCYSCRQLAEISWMFTDEQVRLKLFQRAYALVSDPEKFSDLESTLVQDAALEDFRKISSQYN